MIQRMILMSNEPCPGCQNDNAPHFSSCQAPSKPRDHNVTRGTLAGNVPDERLRAAAEKLVIHDEFLAGIMALIATVRDSAMREAAGLVCRYCVDDRYDPAIENRGLWLHKSKQGPLVEDCRAWPIHGRLAQKEKG
jgi:hypothetical protein